MELALKNLLNFLTIAPHLVPEVFSKPSLRNPIAVSLGAIAGALSRYYFSLWLVRVFGADFPYATILVNLTGSFAMGLLSTLVLEKGLSLLPEIRLLIAVGFLGSYTTFSSYELDTANLVSHSRLNSAFIYWLGSAAVGYFSLYLGIVFARMLR